MLGALLDMIFQDKSLWATQIESFVIDTKNEDRGLGTEMYQELKVKFTL